MTTTTKQWPPADYILKSLVARAVLALVRTPHMFNVRKCDKDIRGHLKAIGVSDSSLDEARLLLVRAGQCICNRPIPKY